MKICRVIISIVIMLSMMTAVPVMANSDLAPQQSFYSSLEKEHLNEFISEADNYSYSNGSYCFEKTTLKEPGVEKEVLSLVLLDPTKKSVVDNNIAFLRTKNRGIGNSSFSDWDSSGSIYASISITYTTSYIGNVQYALLNNVSVARSSNYNGVSVSSQSVSYGCWGSPYQGSAWGQNAYVPLSNSTTSWSVNTPASWLAVSMEADHSIGGTYSLYLKRGTSSNTWNLTVACNI